MSEAYGGRHSKIVNILSSYVTPAGTFDNVYEVLQNYDLTYDDQSTEYWKPGVGFLGEYNNTYMTTGNPESMTLVKYSATPVPPSLLLLGTGLVGLLGIRRFKRC